MESPQEQNTIDSKGKSKKISKKIFALIKNIFCFIIWTWFIFRILGQPFPFSYYFGDILYLPILNIRIIVVVLIVIILLLLLLKFKPFIKFIFFFWLRLIFFPFIALYYFFYFPSQFLKISYKGFNSFLNKFVRTTITKASVILVMIVPISLIISLTSSNIILLIFSIIFIILALIIILRTAFLWTAKPLIIIEEMLSYHEKFMDLFLKRVIKNTGQNTKDSKSVEQELNVLYKSLGWSQKFIEKFTDQRVVLKFFFAIFSICFILTVILFGVLFFTFNKIHMPVFTNSVNWDIFDFIYSSLLIITTSGEMSPIWVIAKLALASEIIFGIGLLSLLIFQFSIISIPEVLEKREEVLHILENQKVKLDNVQRQLIKNLPTMEIIKTKSE